MPILKINNFLPKQSMVYLQKVVAVFQVLLRRLRKKGIKQCNLCHSKKIDISFKVRGHYGLYGVSGCNNCGLLFLSEQYGRMEDIGDVRKMAAGYLSRMKVSFKDEDLYAEYNKHREETFRRYYELIKKEKKGGRVLDVGCGNGFFLTFLDPGDWERKGVDHNLENWRECLRKGLDVARGSFADYPSEGCFDVISMLEYIEHTEDPLSELKKCYFLMKEDGLLLIETGNVESEAAKAQGATWAYFTASPDHKYFFSSKTLTAMVAKAGFQKITFPEGDDREVVLLTARKA